MQDLQAQGLTRAIGVSNFYPDRLVDLTNDLPYGPFEYITRQAQGDFTLQDQRNDNLYMDGGMVTTQADGRAGASAAEMPSAPQICTARSTTRFTASATKVLDTEVSCEAAAVLNVAEDHLDWYTGPTPMDDYARDKGRIFERVRTACVYNVADPVTERLVRDGCRIVVLAGRRGELAQPSECVPRLRLHGVHGAPHDLAGSADRRAHHRRDRLRGLARRCGDGRGRQGHARRAGKLRGPLRRHPPARVPPWVDRARPSAARELGGCVPLGVGRAARETAVTALL